MIFVLQSSTEEERCVLDTTDTNQLAVYFGATVEGKVDDVERNLDLINLQIRTVALRLAEALATGQM